jgi:hypothetical protein
VDPEGLLLWSQATALTTTRSLRQYREEPMGGIHVTTLAGRSYTGIRVPLQVNELTASSFLPHTTYITQCCMLFKNIPARLDAFLDGGTLLIHGAISTAGLVPLSMSSRCGTWTGKGSRAHRSELNWYHSYCLLHVSVFLKIHNQAVKKYIQKDNFNTNDQNYTFLGSWILNFTETGTVLAWTK